MPAFLSLESGFWRFLLVWAAYSGYSLKLMRACRVRPMDKNTPRRVYAWFLAVHKVSVGVGALGYFWCVLLCRPPRGGQAAGGEPARARGRLTRGPAPSRRRRRRARATGSSWAS